MTLSNDGVTLADTRAWVRALHDGQTDKAGAPYVGHVERVAANLARLFPAAAEAERHAALLHDAVEDAGVTAEDLTARGYTDETVAIVLAVTKPQGSGLSYAARIDRLIASGNSGAMRVKIADLTDNLDPLRLSRLPSEKARSLENRYRAALTRLQSALAGSEAAKTDAAGDI